MHELSLISNVIEAVERSAKENCICHVSIIKLEVGKMTAALPEALEFAFSVLPKDALFKNAKLEIKEKEVLLSCKDCSKTFVPPDLVQLFCTRCGSRQVDIVEGKELSIVYFEGE